MQRLHLAPWRTLQVCAHSCDAHGSCEVGMAGDTVLCQSVNGCDFSHRSSLTALPSPQVPELCEGGLSRPPLLCPVAGAPGRAAQVPECFHFCIQPFAQERTLAQSKWRLGQESNWRSRHVAELRIFPNLGLSYSLTGSFFP